MNWCFITLLCLLQTLAPALHAHVGGGHGSSGPHLHEIEIPVTTDPTLAGLNETPGLEVGVSVFVLGRDDIEISAEASPRGSIDVPPLSLTIASMSVPPAVLPRNPAMEGPAYEAPARRPPARASPFLR